MVEERARSARKKRDQTVSQNAHVNPQRELTQQTLTGSTHKKKKTSALQNEETHTTATSWKTQYINGYGQVTSFPPGGGGNPWGKQTDERPRERGEGETNSHGKIRVV
jgi:hypothetical protein